MKKILSHKRALAALPLLGAIVAAPSAQAAATIVILNNDAAGVGFNDTTPVAPVGGNLGVTLGQQRLNAFQAAAAKWGATLDSAVTITIRAQWTALTCTSTSAVLGSAGAIGIFRDFAGAPFASTWYNESLTGKILGADPNAAQPEINANFNVNLGQPGCLDATPFYLGLDNNHGTGIDLVTVLTHEFSHGLGFQTFTNASTGAPNSGFISIYDRFLMDLSSGKSWVQMTNAERAASALNSRKLAWNGPRVIADLPSVLSFGIPSFVVNTPALVAGRYDSGNAAFGPPLTTTPLPGTLKLANDGTGTLTDGCEAFPAGFFTGQIAVMDRGTCSFKTKTLNAQNAGAIASVIVNNAGSPAPALGDDPTIVTPITIPTVSLAQADGAAIVAQIGSGVTVTIALDNATRAGADGFGKGLMFTPNPFQSGSSVSHWDQLATPNLLMEPAINADLTHEVTPPNDLTFSQLRDIGWVASVLPTAISRTSGDLQNTALGAPFPQPISVSATPGAAGTTVTWTVVPAAGAGATFPSTGGNSAVSLTDASGNATAPALVANSTPGTFTLNATVPGAGTTAFTLQNDPPPVAGSACLVDTSQADFAAGIATNTDVTASPGDVVLLNPANLDQQNLSLSNNGNGINNVNWAGQTFVPALTGQLSRVDLSLFCSGCTGTAPSITVSVRATDGSGLPTGADLAAVTFTTSTSGAASFFTATFPTPAPVTAGTQYAIVVRNATNPSVGTNALTRSTDNTAYAPGQRVTSANSGGTWIAATTPSDLGFVTFVQTGNAPSGDFVSRRKDANPLTTTTWDTLTFNASAPAGTTLQFQAAASNSLAGPFNFVGPDGTAATFFASGASLAQFNGNRYLKTKTLMTTTSGALTPVLNDLTVCYTNLAPVDAMFSNGFE